jgi:hypothetical protein
VKNNNSDHVQLIKSEKRYEMISDQTHGFGTPFDFSYFYDTLSDAEYIYQHFVDDEGGVKVLKYEVNKNEKPLDILDTFRLKGFFIEPSTTQSLYLNVFAHDSFYFFKNGIHENDSLLVYFQNRLVKRSRFSHNYFGRTAYVGYNIRFNRLVSPKHMENIYPVYIPGLNKVEYIKSPLFVDSKNKATKGLWAISNHYTELTEIQTSIVESGFSIHLNDRIVYLDPTSETIDLYFPYNQKLKSIKIPHVQFDEKVSDNLTTYQNIMNEETDYWFDFIYNPYLKVYILFQHEGRPYFDKEGDIAVVDPKDIWARIILLDEEFSYISTQEIPYGEELLDIINPKFPTPDGYITIEIDSVCNFSEGVRYFVGLQKMILDGI